jgi:hypothetical protein
MGSYNEQLRLGIQVKEAVHHKVKECPWLWKSLLSNSVTLGTKVRIEILKATAKICFLPQAIAASKKEKGGPIYRMAVEWIS